MAFSQNFLAKQAEEPISACPWWVVLPWLLAGVLIPLIVYQRIIPLEGIQFSYWTGKKIEWDFFTFYKSKWLVGLAILGVILQLDGGPARYRSWWTLPFLGYGMTVVWSSLFSDFPWETLSGSPGRGEGMFVLLAYMWLGLSGMNFAVRRWQVVRWLAVGVLTSSIVVAMIGVAQALGYDPFQQPGFRKWIFQESHRLLAQNPNLVATGNSSAFSTLANSNYSGSYAALIFTFTSGLIYFSPYQRRFWLIPLQLLHFAFVVGSRSKAGLLGGGIGLLGILWMSRRTWRRQWPAFLTLGIGGILIFFVLDYASLKQGVANERLFDNFQRQKIFYDAPRPNDFETMILGSDTVDLQFRSFQIRIGWRGAFAFYDAQGQEIPFQVEGKKVIFPEEVAFRVKASIASEAKIVKIERGDTVVLFQHTDRGFLILDQRGRTFSLREIPRWWVDDNDRWGNGRGFIWSRTLPLLPRYFWLGAGADAFLYVFPNDDFIGKLRAGYGIDWFVDKPHNWYLQVAINTGMISLLLLIGMFGCYLWQSWRLYRQGDFDEERKVLGAALAWAVFGYLITGMFNDSVVGVAPVFWAFLGSGIGLNLLLQTEAQIRDQAVDSVSSKEYLNGEQG